MPFLVPGDHDGDTLPDVVELGLDWGLNPCVADSDVDELDDALELQLRATQHRCLDPTDADSDGDGMHDGAEIVWDSGEVDVDLCLRVPMTVTWEGESNPCEPDTDGDGLTDLVEWQLGTQPWSVDTDEDELWDGEDDDPLLCVQTDTITFKGANVGGGHCGCGTSGSPWGTWIVVGVLALLRRRGAAAGMSP